ncbi:hypothetical protein BJV78DRAFT_37818 [Lactifluus subvellereus]|nr:hypothetical protein BJV78DRAFT_37818 [Lactifluus subvellereus]
MLGMQLRYSLSVGDTVHSLLTPLLLHRHSIGKPCSIPYMHPGSRNTVSEGLQRSQSTPDVGVRPMEQHKRAPRRTKTSIDFLAIPPRNAVHEEKYVDLFNLSGFFPTSPRPSDQEQSGWWRDESLEEESEEFAEEMLAAEGDSNSLGSQRILFGGGEKPADTIIKREDKLGVLSVLIGGWPGRDDDPAEERLHSPYTSDEPCDDEALRLAYETRRHQLWGSSDSKQPERTSKSLFYEGKEEEEAAGWFGLM